MKHLFTFIFILGLTFNALAQEGYQVGQTITGLSVGGKALSDFSSSKVVVVAFVNKNCPNSRLYESRLSKMANSYSSRGVSFLFISPTISMEESVGATKTIADKVPAEDANLPIISDEGQKLSRQFGATKTPEVFVLHNVNGAFILKYKGAIDDNQQLETSVKNAYLQDALNALLANQAVAAGEKRAMGCMIKRF